MCTPWFIINKLAGCPFKVMCKCSYHLNEDGPNRRSRVFPPSNSSSPTTTNPVSSPTSPISQREVSTTFFSSPRSQHGRKSTTGSRFSSSSPWRSQGLEPRKSTAANPNKDEAPPRKSGGTTPKIFLSQLKKGKLKRRVTISSNSSASIDVDEPDWPPFADEDYIVFCFEEDGAFHVVMEESPRTLTGKDQCEEHGNVTCACTDESKDVIHVRPISRRDGLLTEKEVEEEEMSSSNQLKLELHQNRIQTIEDTDLLDKDKIVIRNASTLSMECRNGSVESTDSSQLDWEDQLQDETDLQLRSFSPSDDDDDDDDDEEDDECGSFDFRRDSLLPNEVVDEAEVFLSPKSELGKKMTIDELLGDENDRFSRGSDHSSGFSGSDDKVDQEDCDQHEEIEEQDSESHRSSASDQSESSSSSFEFPALEWQCMGSPVTWPRSGKLHFRKQKSRRLRLRFRLVRCCRV